MLNPVTKIVSVVTATLACMAAAQPPDDALAAANSCTVCLTWNDVCGNINRAALCQANCGTPKFSYCGGNTGGLCPPGTTIAIVCGPN